MIKLTARRTLKVTKRQLIASLEIINRMITKTMIQLSTRLNLGVIKKQIMASLESINCMNAQPVIQLIARQTLGVIKKLVMSWTRRNGLLFPMKFIHKKLIMTF